MNTRGNPILGGIVKLSRFAEVLTEIGLVALMLMVFKEVICRYVFQSPSVYTVEVSEYILIFMTFMASAWVLHTDRHVSMTVVTCKLPKKLALILDCVTSVLTMGLCAVVIWTGMQTVVMALEGDYRSASLLNFPLWISYSFICVGFALLFLQYIVRIADNISRLKDDEKGACRWTI
ncbi:MAG: TRAP transporter small permease [Desulfovibrionaceae bacterium]|jgi:TRAP-type C4-dicarboxylate transport system permease small subunit|nr:TRAP transporter small permease [Desulfovibrionaceae bacterium]